MKYVSVCKRELLPGRVDVSSERQLGYLFNAMRTAQERSSHQVVYDFQRVYIFISLIPSPIFLIFKIKLNK